MDMWLALEAYEMTLMRQFDYVVLVASDSDYVPLVRKIGALGIPVILLSWDFEYVNDEQQRIVTRTSQELLNEVSIPLSMHEIIENSIQEPNSTIESLFVPRTPERTISRPLSLDELNSSEGEIHISDIQNLKSGYGFINFEPANLFFHYSSLVGLDFNDLQVGDRVRFSLGTNERGDAIAQNVELVEDETL
jgi:cold shock CspA family protein